MRIKKYFFSVIVLALSLSVPRLYAGGMIEDTDGTADAEHVEIKENTAVDVYGTGILLESGTTAMFYRQDGLKSGMLYRGMLAEKALFPAGGIEVEVPEDNLVWFYKSGKLKYTTATAEPAVFNVQDKDVLFLSLYNLYNPLGFHENGSLHQGVLAAPSPFEVQGRSYLFKDRIVFSDSGMLLYGIPAEDIIVEVQEKQVAVSGGSSVSFYNDGSVRECGFLKKDTYFRAGGKEVLFTSRSPAPAAAFYQNGNIMYGSLAENTDFDLNGEKLRFKAGAGRIRIITFYESGAVKSGHAADLTELIFEGRAFKAAADSYLEFSEAGEIIMHNKGVSEPDRP